MPSVSLARVSLCSVAISLSVTCALACRSNASSGSEPHTQANGAQPVPKATLVVATAPPASSTAPNPQPGKANQVPGTECRAPDEPSCLSCCISKGDAKCVVLSWAPDGLTPEQAAQIDPWYNASDVLSQACPTTCK